MSHFAGKSFVLDLGDDAAAVARAKLGRRPRHNAFGGEIAASRLEAGPGHIDHDQQRAVADDRHDIKSERAGDIFDGGLPPRANPIAGDRAAAWPEPTAL